MDLNTHLPENHQDHHREIRVHSEQNPPTSHQTNIILQYSEIETNIFSQMNHTMNELETKLATTSIQKMIVPFYQFKTWFHAFRKIHKNVPNTLVVQFNTLQQHVYLKLEHEESIEDIDSYE